MTYIDILKIVSLFLIPANIFLLALLRGKLEKILGNFVTLVIAYGISPLLNGLFFYYLIWLFPKRGDLFYEVIILSIWIILFIFGNREISKLINLYREVILSVRGVMVFRKKFYLFLPICFILLLTTIQALFYPIADNDKALYLNQSEAVYQYKNLDWQKKDNAVIIRGDDEYKYNSSIRPAIPSFMAVSFLFHKEKNSYFVFNFLSTYYYFLLFVLFLFVIYIFSILIHKNFLASVFFGSLFFVFSWGLSNTLVFNSKENIIYFLAILGLYLAYLITTRSKRQVKVEVILGTVLGLNSFVNLHGIIIEALSLILLFIFSSLRFKDRFFQVLSIILVSSLAGGFEIKKTFGFVFWGTIKKILDGAGYIVHESLISPKNEIVAVENLVKSPASSAVSNLDATHRNLYQVKSFSDIYLKGKLQIFTNIGVFGFYVWFFVAALFYDFKNILKNKLCKIIILFIAIYFVVVTDPLNLNKNQYAIVLWGSTKYAKLLLLLSLVFVSVFTNDLLKKTYGFFSKYQKTVIIGLSLILLSLVLLKEKITAYLLKILLSSIQIYKESAFYEHKVETFYYMGILFVASMMIILLMDRYGVRKKSFEIFVILSILFFVVVPFSITDAGKIPLTKTFFWIGADNETKLKNTLIYGDIYNVYFYAKNSLPGGTLLETSFNEVYTYDDYFQLRKEYSTDVKYGIDTKCDGREPLYNSGNVYLCQEKL